MRAKKPFLIVGFLCSWTILSYVIYVRKTDTSKQLNENHIGNERYAILQKLQYLEDNIKLESQRHDALVHQLLNIAKYRKGAQPSQPQQQQQQQQQQQLVNAKSSSTTATIIKFQNVDDVGPVHKMAVGHVERIDTENRGQPLEEISNPLTKDVSAVREIPLEPNRAVTEEVAPDVKLKALLKENIPNNNFDGPVIPVLVFACNRVSVRICLENLLKYRPNAGQFPIIVSQDCNDETTRNVIESYKDVTLIRQPDQRDIPIPPKDKKFKGYYKISRHYGWALNTTFQAGFDYTIIVEDDLNVSPDFFDYFLATHELLKNDESLWCVSAWNDNGKAGIIDETRSDLLYRSDFFPGLGWMLTRKLWGELSVKWPKAFWDDWMRNPQQRKERACIRPEISRTRTFGKIGVSNGLFFEKHLKYIKLNEQYVSFTKLNLTYLLKQNYDSQFLKYVYSCPVVTYEELRRGMITTKDPVRIQYNTKDQFIRTAKLLGLMDDLKSGVPRTGYHGIVSFFYNNQRVYLAPNSNWKGYEIASR